MIFVVLICIYRKFKKNDVTDIVDEIEGEDITEKKKKSKENKNKKKTRNSKSKD